MLKTSYNSNKQPLISVAMTTFNGEMFLVEQINSILNQTYKNIEIIISDDCSSVDTINILKKFETRNNVSVFYNKENIGFIKNFEKAISLCSGDYIALADQDDIWLTDKIEQLVNNIGSNLCIHSDATLIDQNGREIADSFSRSTQKLCYPNSYLDLILNGCLTGCTCLFSKELVSKIVPIPKNIDSHDKWIGLVAFNENALTYLDLPTIMYRQHESNSIGANYSNEFNAFSLFRKFFLNKKKYLFIPDPKFKKDIQYKLNLISSCLIKMSNGLEHANELDKVFKLQRSLSNLFSSKNKIKGFIGYIKFISYFEKNKSISFKLLCYLNIARNLVVNHLNR